MSDDGSRYVYEEDSGSRRWVMGTSTSNERFWRKIPDSDVNCPHTGDAYSQYWYKSGKQ